MLFALRILFVYLWVAVVFGVDVIAEDILFYIN
jgi:hypothetical protein